MDANVADGASGDLYGGGGIGARGDSAVIGTEVSNNDAVYGCGFSSTLGTLTFTDGSIHDNGVPFGICAYGGGGQVYLGNLVLAGATVVRANYGNYGGGLMVQESTLVGGLVDGNSCGQEGGGIYISGGSSVTDAIVVNNTAPVGGGGVLLRFGGRFVGGVVSGNTSPVGAGFSNTYDGLLEIDGTEITDNVASDDGGGIYQFDGAVTLTNAVVLRNTANRGGGAFLAGGTLQSTTSDWGAAADDNLPDDVRAGSSLAGYEADATFSCELGCDPLP